MNGAIEMPPLLRAIVSRSEDDLWEAKLLELNIAVSAEDQDDLCKEIEHALRVAYHAALKYGCTPLVGFVRDQIDEQDLAHFDSVDTPSLHHLSLDAEIMAALNMALRHEIPVARIEVAYAQAA